ncbi:hypothetical protein Pcinc_013580 [Petrolisthes cinctipes]|uniref:Uncharacterized protein n=1 Tax=Petrolisthes cinctipes TaxID=88211 RepID=A0AAE1KU66_PETCI|nr:hypothetical protein Pcinc_013580 [Petrolisthes cinctipes]
MKIGANMASFISAILVVALSLLTRHPVVTLPLVSTLLPSPSPVAACTSHVTTQFNVTNPYNTIKVLTLTNVECQEVEVGKNGCQCPDGYVCVQLQQYVADATQGHREWKRGCTCMTTKQQAVVYSSSNS